MKQNVKKKKELIKKQKVKKDKVKKKFKIKWKNVVITLLILITIILLLLTLLNIRITNIYIRGNNIVSDQEIIDTTKINNYPSILTLLINNPLKKLNDNELILNYSYDLDFTKLYININDNYPLFYDLNKNETILLNGASTKEKLDSPTLINYVPDTIYSYFKEKISYIDFEIIKRINEIKYAPDNVDENRFLLSMTDSNYVYLTLTKFENLNNYVSIIKEFPGKKGILYLNAGNSFEVLEK